LNCGGRKRKEKGKGVWKERLTSFFIYILRYVLTNLGGEKKRGKGRKINGKGSAMNLLPPLHVSEEGKRRREG